MSRLDPLAAVEEKVAQGERLSAADGLALFESPDLLRVGRLADRVRRRKVGDDVYFVVNRHINYTNVCRNRCRFCAFSRERGRAGRLHAHRRRSAGQGARGCRAGGHRDPHRGRREPVSALRRDPGDGGGHPRAVARPCTSRPSPLRRSRYFADAEGSPAEEVLRDLKAAGSGQPARRGGRDPAGRGAARRSARPRSRASAGWRSTSSRTGWV